MAITAELKINETPEKIGSGNQMPSGDDIDPREQGMAGLRMLLDQSLLSVEGFGQTQLQAAGVSVEDLVKFREEMGALLKHVVQDDGRRPSRRRERAAAMRILGHIRVKDAIPLLAEVLDAVGEEPSQRTAAADGLGMMRSEEAAPVLARHLSDPYAVVQANVALALGKVASPAFLETLKTQVVRAEESTVRRAMVRAVRSIEERHHLAASLPDIADNEKRGGSTIEADIPPAEKWKPLR